MLLIVALRTDKEMNRRKDMIANLRSKVNQMSSALSSNSGNRDSLLGPEINKADAMGRTVGLDNYGLVGLQRQVMKGKFLNLFRTQTFLFFLIFSFMEWLSKYGTLLYFTVYLFRARWGAWEIGGDRSKHKTYCIGSQWGIDPAH